LAAGDPRHLTSSRESARLFGTAAAASGFPSFETAKLRFELKEDAMTDPRFTDPRYSDPLSDPVIRRDERVGGMWGWIAGVAVLLLIGFLIVAGWNNNSNTASSGSAPTAASHTATPPSTTGSGSTSSQPFTPAPSKPTPPPSNSDKQ
jgi:hypothetical protein